MLKRLDLNSIADYSYVFREIMLNQTTICAII